MDRIDNVEQVHSWTALEMWNMSTLGQDCKHGIVPECDESKNMEWFHVCNDLKICNRFMLGQSWKRGIVPLLEESKNVEWFHAWTGMTMYFPPHLKDNHAPTIMRHLDTMPRSAYNNHTN